MRGWVSENGAGLTLFWGRGFLTVGVAPRGSGPNERGRGWRRGSDVGGAWEGEGPSPGSQCHKQALGGGGVVFPLEFPFFALFIPIFPCLSHLFIIIFPGRGEEGGLETGRPQKWGSLPPLPLPPPRIGETPKWGGGGRKGGEPPQVGNPPPQRKPGDP